MYSTLRNRFVCGYKNIYKEKFAGNSGVHPMESSAVTTTNGAGPHNVQLFILSEDGTVLHCLPGYWDPNDLQSELDLAQKLNDVWLNNSITPTQKIAQFKQLQMQHLAGHSPQTVARSHLQHFDAQYIAKHAHGPDGGLNDAIAEPALLASCQAAWSGGPKEGMSMNAPMEAFKTTDRIMHERMCRYPFVPYENFDVVAYTNYGTHFYDKNENEMAGVMRPDLKRMNLHRVTHDAIGAPRSAGGGRGKNRFDPVKKFYELSNENKYSEALQYASNLCTAKPTDPTGWELRAVAEYGMGMYDQAYNDATRAAWLGSRSAANSDLRKKAQERMGARTGTPKVSLH